MDCMWVYMHIFTVSYQVSLIILNYPFKYTLIYFHDVHPLFLIWSSQVKVKSLTEIPKREGGGVHSRGSFCPQRPLPMARSASLLRGLGRK